MAKRNSPRSGGFVIVVVLLVLAVLALATCDVSRTLGEGLVPEVTPCVWLR
ncbi:MAG: hypothetical protein HC828_21545 [Blastochloris sp.]|nr:hypothetical protein [Blastochloris sp.]